MTTRRGEVPRAKTIRSPSGDQAGWTSSALVEVSCRVPLPSASIAYRSNVPARLLANAIVLPSGDQAGSVWKKSASGWTAPRPLR